MPGFIVFDACIELNIQPHPDLFYGPVATKKRLFMSLTSVHPIFPIIQHCNFVVFGNIKDVVGM